MPTNQTTVPAAANDIRDIKPPMDITGSQAWLWWSLLALALVIAAWLLWRWRKNRKRGILLPPPVPAHPFNNRTISRPATTAGVAIRSIQLTNP